MLSEHVAVAWRIQRDVDAELAAAAAKRRAFLDEFVAGLRIEAGLQRERDRITRNGGSARQTGSALDRTHASRTRLADESERADATESTLDGAVAA